MVDNIGQYQINNYPYPYNQAGFNGDPAMLGPLDNTAVAEHVQSTPVGQVTSDFIPTNPKDMIKEAPYLGLGVGIGFGIKYLLEKIAKGIKLENTPIAQAMEKLDKSWVVQNPVYQKFEKFIYSLIDKSKDSYKKLPEKSLRKTIIDSLNIGTEPRFMFAKGLGIKKQSIDYLLGEIKTVAEYFDDPLIKKIIKEVGEKTGKEAFDILEKNLKGVSKNLVFEIPRKSGLFNLGKLLEKIRGKRQINLNLEFIKTQMITGKNTGSLLNRGIKQSTYAIGESLSGAVIGGPIGVLMNAVFLGHSIKVAADAPKGEKLSTFMEDFLGNMVGGFLMMGPSMSLVNKLGGLKYVGMTRKLEENALNGFKYIGKLENKPGTVKEAMDGLTKLFVNATSKAEKIAIKAEFKKVKNLADKGLIRKTLRFFGNILSVGLKDSPAISVGKIGNLAKRCGGFFLRGALLMLVIMPLLSKPFVKLSHKLFGKPTKSIFDESKEEKSPQNPSQNQPVQNNNVINQQFNNFLTQTRAGSPAIENILHNQPVNNQPLPIQPIPNQMVNSQPIAPKRRYLPSTNPVNFSDQNTDILSSAMEKSDKMIEQANRLLKNL